VKIPFCPLKDHDSVVCVNEFTNNISDRGFYRVCPVIIMAVELLR
jgi:hypothetical protein